MFLVRTVPDNWNFNSSNPCLHVGGNYNQNQNYGLFHVNYNTASNTNDNIGCRTLVLLGKHLHYGTGNRAPLGGNLLIGRGLVPSFMSVGTIARLQGGNYYPL